MRVTVDVVLFTIREGELSVLLIERGKPPFLGAYALPGGFVREDESLDAAAARELAEETGVRDVPVEQVGAFGDPGRDPRARVVTIAYAALWASDRTVLAAGTDAAAAAWHRVRGLPALAFDHARIVAHALARLRAELDSSGAAFALLPARFTLTDLQRVHEAVLGRALDKRNFRRKVEQSGRLRALSAHRREGVQRPARLYTPARVTTKR